MSGNEPAIDRTRFDQAIHERWPELTDDQLREIKGDVAILVGKIQAAYGLNRDQARAAVREFLDANGLSGADRI